MKKFGKFMGFMVALAVVLGFASCKDDDGDSSGTPSVSVTGVTLNETSKYLEVGDTFQLVATVAPANASNKKVTWSSSNDEVATVSATGLVTGVAASEEPVTITAKTASGGKTATCEVTIQKEGSLPPAEAEKKTHDALVAQTNKLVDEDFSGYEDNTKLPFHETYGISGVYSKLGEGSTTEKPQESTHFVSVIGGKAVQNREKDKTGETLTVVDFGETEGIIEGSVDLSVLNKKKNWTFFRLYGTSKAKTSISEVFGLRGDEIEVPDPNNSSNKQKILKLGYRLDGGTLSENLVDFTDEMTVYFKFDPSTGRLSVVVTQTIEGEEVSTTLINKVPTTEINKIVGIVLATNNSNNTENSNVTDPNKVTLDNVIICGSLTANAQALKDAKDAAVTEIESYQGSYASLDSAHQTTELLAKITAAQEAGKEAINAATTPEAVAIAKSNAKTAIDNTILAETQNASDAKETAIAQLNVYVTNTKAAFANDEDFSVDPLINDLIDAEKTTQTTAIENAASAQEATALDVYAALDAAKVAIEKVKSDRKAAEYTVKFMNGSEEISTVPVGYGESVPTRANPTKENSKFIKWVKTDGGSEEYDFTEKLYLANEEVLSIYASWKDSDATLTFKVDSETVATIKAYSGDKYSDYDIPTPVSKVSGKKASDWSPATDFLNGTVSAGEHSFESTTSDWKTNEELAQTEFDLTGVTEGGSISSNVLVPGNLARVVLNDVLTGTDSDFKDRATYVVIPKENKVTFGSGENAKSFTSAVRSSEIATGSDSKSIYTITALENIHLKVYAAAGPKNGYQANRQGYLKYKKNNGDPVTLANATSSALMQGFIDIDLNVGDVIELFCKFTNSNGRLHLYGVEATVSDSFTNMNVILNKKTGGNETIAWSTLKGGNALKALAESKSDTNENDAFVGWSTTNGGDVVANWNSVTLTAGNDLNLYSKFAESNVTINYYEPDENNSNFTVKNTVRGLSGTKTVRPADPTLTGYNFKGWYKEQAFANLYDFDSLLEEGTMDLYAKFVKLYTVTFNVGDGTMPDADKTQSVEDGAKATKPTDPTPPSGKVFAGWYEVATPGENDAAFNFETTTITSDKGLYAKWETPDPNLVNRPKTGEIAAGSVVVSDEDLGISITTVSKKTTVSDCSSQKFKHETDNISFGKAFLPDKGGSYSITTTKAITLTLYVAAGDGSYKIAKNTTEFSVQLKEENDVKNSASFSNSNTKSSIVSPVEKISVSLEANKTYTLVSTNDSMRPIPLGIFVE